MLRSMSFTGGANEFTESLCCAFKHASFLLKDTNKLFESLVYFGTQMQSRNLSQLNLLLLNQIALLK